MTPVLSASKDTVSQEAASSSKVPLQAPDLEAIRHRWFQELQTARNKQLLHERIDELKRQTRELERKVRILQLDRQAWARVRRREYEAFEERTAARNLKLKDLVAQISEHRASCSGQYSELRTLLCDRQKMFPPSPDVDHAV